MILKYSHYFLLLLFFPAGVMAASGIDSLMTTSSVWRMFLSLAFVIAMIPLALFAIKKLQGVQHKFGKSPIQIVNVQALGAKEKLVIVTVEEQRLLLGVTSQSISLLKTLSDKDVVFSEYLDKGLEDKLKESSGRST